MAGTVSRMPRGAARRLHRGRRTERDVLPQSGSPNALQPRKRPRATLTPTMITRDGAPFLAFGTPGGDGVTASRWPSTATPTVA